MAASSNGQDAHDHAAREAPLAQIRDTVRVQREKSRFKSGRRYQWVYDVRPRHKRGVLPLVRSYLSAPGISARLSLMAVSLIVSPGGI